MKAIESQPGCVQARAHLHRRQLATIHCTGPHLNTSERKNYRLVSRLVSRWCSPSVIIAGLLQWLLLEWRRWCHQSKVASQELAALQSHSVDCIRMHALPRCIISTVQVQTSNVLCVRMAFQNSVALASLHLASLSAVLSCLKAMSVQHTKTDRPGRVSLRNTSPSRPRFATFGYILGGRYHATASQVVLSSLLQNGSCLSLCYHQQCVPSKKTLGIKGTCAFDRHHFLYIMTSRS